MVSKGVNVWYWQEMDGEKDIKMTGEGGDIQIAWSHL